MKMTVIFCRSVFFSVGHGRINAIPFHIFAAGGILLWVLSFKVLAEFFSLASERNKS